MLQLRYFAQCILDEATQAPEPAALVAIAQKVRGWLVLLTCTAGMYCLTLMFCV